MNQSSLESSSFMAESGINVSTAIHLVRHFRSSDELLLDGWCYSYAKRFIDITVALFLLVLFFVPGLLIAAAIRATSKGPIFYREQRVGRFGKIFKIWKFRSMRTNSDHKLQVTNIDSGASVLDEWRMQKGGHDPRVTRIGRFIRKWSLDEVPQLINVLRGEMSLIGPRPIVESEAKFYGDLYVYYLAALPGLSGLWQVSGRSQIGYKERSELDAHYVTSWSVKTDVAIFFRTFSAVLGRAGAH